ncbi:MAG: nucleoside triphosphate pyrophosphohydrolase family protein, partial [Acidobacteria bacterium]|nr:nucleoside triphosphate pyrophosphohydrolase family protein [Acidobacteriota bacterium]
MTIEAKTVAFEEYQDVALSTDQNRTPSMGGIKFPMLGLFGEVGSLMAEVKKKQRDGVAHGNFREAILEELGDVLWY